MPPPVLPGTCLRRSAERANGDYSRHVRERASGIAGMSLVSARGVRSGRLEAVGHGVGREPELLEELGARGVREEPLRDAVKVCTGTTIPASRRADVTGIRLPRSRGCPRPPRRRRRTGPARRGRLTGRHQRGSTTRTVWPCALSFSTPPWPRSRTRPSPTRSSSTRRRRRLVQDVDRPDGSDGGQRVRRRRPWGNAGRSARRRRRAPRAAARPEPRRHGVRRGAGRDTTEVRVMSHMPLCEAPSLPVIAGPVEDERHPGPVQCAVHEHLVEGAVEERRIDATTGCSPAKARPEAMVTACCSAMPTSKTRSG